MRKHKSMTAVNVDVRGKESEIGSDPPWLYHVEIAMGLIQGAFYLACLYLWWSVLLGIPPGPAIIRLMYHALVLLSAPKT